MAVIFIAIGQGLMEVRIPNPKAVPAAMMNSLILRFF
jgi:hypothetical protein